MQEQRLNCDERRRKQMIQVLSALIRHVHRGTAADSYPYILVLEKVEELVYLGLSLLVCRMARYLKIDRSSFFLPFLIFWFS